MYLFAMTYMYYSEGASPTYLEANRVGLFLTRGRGSLMVVLPYEAPCGN
jgi:hypothetical protein